MAEEEIAWLERKVDALKRKLYLEKELAEKWEVLPLKQVQHQQHQRLISKPLPPPRPDRSQNYQLKKQYRIRKDRRASVGSSIDFHTIYSPINLNGKSINARESYIFDRSKKIIITILATYTLASIKYVYMYRYTLNIHYRILF